MNNSIQTQHKQSGAVMMISAVMLIVIGMLTMSLMSMSRMQVHMAMNEEMRINAIQSAKSSNEAIIGNPSTTPVVGGVGYKLCSTNMSGCDQYTLLMPTDEMAALITNDFLSAIVFRAEPLFRNPPRGTDWSLDKFTSTTFTVQSTFDRTEDGQGNSSINEGLIVMLPL
jgi:hypothetical protein